MTPNGPWKEPRELVPDGDHEGGVARGTPKEAAPAGVWFGCTPAI